MIVGILQASKKLGEEARRVGERTESIPFDAVYGFWGYQNLTENARGVLHESLARLQ